MPRDMIPFAGTTQRNFDNELPKTRKLRSNMSSDDPTLTDSKGIRVELSDLGAMLITTS